MTNRHRGWFETLDIQTAGHVVERGDEGLEKLSALRSAAKPFLQSTLTDNGLTVLIRVTAREYETFRRLVDEWKPADEDQAINRLDRNRNVGGGE